MLLNLCFVKELIMLKVTLESLFEEMKKRDVREDARHELLEDKTQEPSARDQERIEATKTSFNAIETRLLGPA